MLQTLFGRARTVLMVLVLILVWGGYVYVTIPKESVPDIDIPIFFVTVVYPGITAADAERLLIRPLERELQALEGLDEMQAWAGEGFAMIRLDFAAAWPNRRALADLREAVDVAQAELPGGAEEPRVREVDVSLFPILTATLSGPVPERTLVQQAERLRDRLEALPGVLEVVIGGRREEVLEILLDPLILESYGITYAELNQAVQRNNQLVAAGAVDTGAGRIGVRVPGTIENPDELLNTAVRVENDTVVRVRDIATVRPTFKDPESFARIEGQPAVSLEIRKRAGANTIEVVAAARALIEAERAAWPDALQVTWLQDQGESIEQMLGDLENNVITAILLVLLIMLAVLGPRAGLLVALAIPGAFLAGLLSLSLLGVTLNIVVLFGLILVVGLLVDGAIIVVEQADRYLAEGMTRPQAFLRAAHRMAWPIIAATGTTLAVFFPMLFWPGFVGEFIRYLPLTVLLTLIASLAMALLFIPVLGAVVGPTAVTRPRAVAAIQAAEAGRFESLQGFNAGYVRLLRQALQHPAWTLAATLAIVGVIYLAYGVLGRGTEFFPEIEPEFVQVQVQARGNLSVWEQDALVRQVERQLRGMPEIEVVYARTIGSQQARLQGNLADDVIGIVQLELIHWRLRPPARAMLPELRERVAQVPGVVAQIRLQDQGMGEGKPIVVEVRGRDRARLRESVAAIRELMGELGGFVDVEDDRPLPLAELEIRVDREAIARYGADIAVLGEALQLVTGGVLLGTHRPEYADEEVEIRLRYPLGARDLGQLARLRLPTEQGLVPITNFVTMAPVPSTGLLKRIGNLPGYTIEADVAGGERVDARGRALRAGLAGLSLPEGVEVRLRGEAEEQAEAAGFLLVAFIFALFLMVLMLVTQLNSFYQAMLVLSAIVFSSAGVLLGLMLRGEPFGVVMSGIGLLALAGIVVNNNIVLIDTWNVLRRQGLPPLEAALRTGAQRLRPVLLTAVTTIFGLLPMMLGLTIDFTGRDLSLGAPATQFWVQLATTIIGGLMVTTPLTLLFTPAMLVWQEGRRERRI